MTSSQVKERVASLHWKLYLANRDEKWPKEWSWREMDASALRPIWLPSYHPKISSLRYVRLLMGHESSGEKLMARGIDGDFSGPCGHLLEDLPHWLESCPRLELKDEFRLILDSELKKSKVKIPTNEVINKFSLL